MYGFIGSVSLSSDSKVSLYCEPHKNHPKLLQDETCSDNFQVKRLTLDKFANDKVFYESEDTVIVVEGVIYNFRELEKKYGTSERGRLLEKMYMTSSAQTLANDLNGFYSMLLYDKSSKKLCLITDHISYKPLWYYKSDGVLIFSTDIHWLYKTLSASGIQLQPEYDGIYCLINYGYMLGDITPVKGCRKLLAGNIAEYSLGKIDIVNYYTLPDVTSQERGLSSEQYDTVLGKIDASLEKSVRYIYEKDDEYGYKHCMTLSGGLDSRTVLFMANRLGYKTTCFTMGESNCNDIKIASKICHDLKLEHLVYELDNGNFLFNIDAAIEANGATILYPGFAHTFQMNSLINFNDFGSVHSGDVGDAILGGSLVGNQTEIDIRSAMYGTDYIDRFSEEFKETEKHRYSDSFRFNYYNRGLNSAGNGCFATHYYTECSSPFVDRELCNVCFSIPESQIKNHKVYLDYLKRYLPDSCNYIWEKTACKPGAGRLKRYIVKWKQRIQLHIFRQSVSMNPFEKWYRENPDIKAYFDHIFKDAETIKKDNSVLYEDLVKRFNSSRVIDKSLACEAVAFIKKYNVKL